MTSLVVGVYSENGTSEYTPSDAHIPIVLYCFEILIGEQLLIMQASPKYSLNQCPVNDE